MLTAAVPMWTSLLMVDVVGVETLMRQRLRRTRMVLMVIVLMMVMAVGSVRCGGSVRVREALRQNHAAPLPTETDRPVTRRRPG